MGRSPSAPWFDAAVLRLTGPAALARSAGNYVANAVTFVDPGCNGFFDGRDDTSAGPGPAIVGTGGGRNCGARGASGSATAQAGLNFVAASSGSAGGLGGRAVGSATAKSASTFVIANANLAGKPLDDAGRLGCDPGLAVPQGLTRSTTRPDPAQCPAAA